MRLLLLIGLLPLAASQGWFNQMFDDDDGDMLPRGFTSLFGLADDDEPTETAVRPIRPIQKTSQYLRNIIDTAREEERPQVIHPVRAFSSNSLPESVSSVKSVPVKDVPRRDLSKFPAGLFLDTAENLFTKMFSFFKPEQVTWHVVRPDPDDFHPRSTLEKADDRVEGSGEAPRKLTVLDDDEGNDRDPENQIIDRISNFFDKIGASAVSSTQLTGPHICVRELTKKVEPTKEKSSFRQCSRFEKAVRCVEKKSDKKGGLETTRIQECCDGFDTDEISKNGCNRESVLMSARDTLSLANSSFVDLLDEAGLTSVLDGTDRVTFIVPTNDAIERMKRSSMSNLKQLLSNHIINGDKRDYEMENGEEFYTLANATVSVSQKDDGRRQRTSLNCVRLTSTNLRTSSGLIHYAADSLALSSASILDYLEDTDRFKTFVSLITPDLERKLRSNESHYTVFAFSDEAFAALSESVRTNVISKSACVKDLIINHIVKGSLCSSELEDKLVVSLGGQVLRVHTMVDKNGTHSVHIGSARIVESDRYTTNGVVHVIDDVILLENLLTWRDHLLTYNSPLLDALSDLSMDSEPFTIFVPPVNASTGSLDMDVFSLNHVAENRLILNPAEKQNVTTITNSTFFMGVFKSRAPFSVSLNLNGDGIRYKPVIGCSRIINQSIHACNSVLHFIDKPLPIIEGDLRWLFETREDLKRFNSLWKASDVADLLDTTTPITVFPPSDDAMSRNQYNALLKNETLLNAFVRRYIVKGPLCAFDLRSNGDEFKYDLIPNEAGEVLHPDSYKGELHIHGAKVQEAEIITSNGIVYILETPIHKTPGVRSVSPISFADVLGLTPILLSQAA